MLNTTQEFWKKSWIKYIESYLNTTPRAGIFIQNYFKNINSVLEIAGGSCRDSRYLANHGFDATGSDFDGNTLKYLQTERFPKDKLKYSEEDAFSLTFSDNSFDLIFHNGFFIYFNNQQIINMLKEQARVSRKFIVVFIHNVNNSQLIKTFHEKGKEDDLYKIRFFDKNELSIILKKSEIDYKNIKVMKFGGKSDAFYNKTLKKAIPNILYFFRKWLIPKLYQFQKWENTERVCCIIELNK